MIIYGILILLIPINSIVMLCIIWREEGWKKVLKILGWCLGSLVLISIVGVAFGMTKEKNPAGLRIIGMLWYGGWSAGLLVYNIYNRYINS